MSLRRGKCWKLNNTSGSKYYEYLSAALRPGGTHTHTCFVLNGITYVLIPSVKANRGDAQTLPVRSAVVFQYCSCFVSRQTADLHQLPGKHFLHSLTLEKQAKSHDRTNKARQQRVLAAYFVFDSAVVKFSKGNERAGRGLCPLLLADSVALQLSGAADQRLVLR